MGMRQCALAVTGTLLGGVLVLTGCTAPSSRQSPPPFAETRPSNLTAPHGAIIFEVQKSMVEGSQTLGTLLRQYSGKGPAVLHVPPLANGQKRLGFTVICSGSSQWTVSVDQVGPGGSSGTCSMKGGISTSYALPVPTKESIIKVAVAADADVWVTVYSTK